MSGELIYKQLVVELKTRLGSAARLGQRLGVSEKTIQGWLKKSEDDLRRGHKSNLDAIVSLANDLGVELDLWRISPSLWDPRSSYSENLDLDPPEPARPSQPFIDHAISFLGFSINSPIGVGPSPLTATGSRIRFFAESGSDVLTLRSARVTPGQAKHPPNVLFCARATEYLDPEGFVNNVPTVSVDDSPDSALALNGVVYRFSNAYPPLDIWQAEIRAALGFLRSGQLLIVSVKGDLRGHDREQLLLSWESVISRAVEAGAFVLELNLSCPADRADQPPLELSLVQDICRRARSVAPDAKVLLKTGYQTGDSLQRFIRETAGMGLCDGFSGINSVPVFAQHLNHDLVFGGHPPKVALAGKPILTLGLRCVHEIAEIRAKAGLKFALIGMGGIHKNQDLLAYLNSGADVVQVTSACFADSYFPFKLRKFYDSQARRAEKSTEGEREFALANFAKASSQLEKDLKADHGLEDRIVMAAQAVMAAWMRRQDNTAALGPLRSRKAPSIEECKVLIQRRLISFQNS